MLFRALLLAGFFALAGCAAQPAGPEPFTTKPFTAPVGTALEVNTGDALYVSGSYIPGERISISKPLDMMVPGSMFIPFPVHIDSGHLELSSITSKWRYFCAEDGRAAASFPGLGSVIRRGDCVGIRISANGKTKQWVVDNSVYNGMTTIWTKSMSESDTLAYTPKQSPLPFKVDRLNRIVFDGYYGGQLHFTWEETIGTQRESKEFTFDFQKDSPKTVGIKGNLFRVLSADDVMLRYEWIKFY